MPAFPRFFGKNRGCAAPGELIRRDRFQVRRRTRGLGSAPRARDTRYVVLGGGFDSSVRLTIRASASALYGFGSQMTLEPEPS